jgi:hypothetical protein
VCEHPDARKYDYKACDFPHVKADEVPPAECPLRKGSLGIRLHDWHSECREFVLDSLKLVLREERPTREQVEQIWERLARELVWMERYPDELAPLIVELWRRNLVSWQDKEEETKNDDI